MDSDASKKFISGLPNKNGSHLFYPYKYELGY